MLLSRPEDELRIGFCGQVELYEHSTLSSDFDEEYSEPLNRAVRFCYHPFAPGCALAVLG